MMMHYVLKKDAKWEKLLELNPNNEGNDSGNGNDEDYCGDEENKSDGC